jgi:hypothetical protein
MFRRLAQVERIEDEEKRYNGFMTTMASAITAPNFTEVRMGAAPERRLISSRNFNSLLIQDGLQPRGRLQLTPSKDPNARCSLIELPFNKKFSLRCVRCMKHGLASRLLGIWHTDCVFLGNDSRLLMHIDQPETHVISCILHVGHSDDSEPWPLFIEDFQGNTNEVILEPR